MPQDFMDILFDAQRAHREGNVEQAEELYRTCLAREPRNPDALHFSGMLLFQTDRLEEGLRRVRESLDIAPGNPHAWNNLGNMLAASHDNEGAVAAYHRATELEPRLALTWYNLGIVLRRMRRTDECVAAFCNALDLEPAHGAVYERLGMVLYALKRFEQAADIYRRWLKVEPESPLARHMLAAMTGDHVPERAGDDYVARLFDEFSDSFDAQLRNLEYRAPELLSAAVLGELPAGRTQVVLDAGCGTGLCGPMLRSVASRLVGVDLSAGMIAHARERQVYDELHVAELTAFIAAHPRTFDVIISADTLVYFGALEAFAAAAAQGLRERGLLGFTVERRDEGDAPYVLEPHGRYSHRPPYVVAVLRGAGFTMVEEQQVILRKESGKDVAGLLVVARLQAPETGIPIPGHSLA